MRSRRPASALRRLNRACGNVGPSWMERLEERVLLSGTDLLSASALGASSSQQPTTSDAQAVPEGNQMDYYLPPPNTYEMSLTPGAQVYLYGAVGAQGITPLASGTGTFLDDTAGVLATGLVSTAQSTDSFSTLVPENSDMIGVGVSGFNSMQALYGQNVAAGPGTISSGGYTASVTFTLTQSALVVAMGLGSSQQGITFSGPTGLATDVTTNATNDVGIGRASAAGIAHADLAAGTYTITEATSIISQGMTIDNIVDLLVPFPL
jgi:hypothetical protein